MPFSANAPAYSGRPSFVSQSVISCIAAHARLIFGPVDLLDGRLRFASFAHSPPEGASEIAKAGKEFPRAGAHALGFGRPVHQRYLDRTG
jgi:hypothetical protein